MAECAHALLFSVLLVCLNVNVYRCKLPQEVETKTKSKSEGCVVFTFLGIGGFLFTAAVFNAIAALNINVFGCQLPMFFLFLYEFLLSLFLMEAALYLIWNPLQEFMTKSLPVRFEELLIQDGRCALYGLYCKGHTLFYEMLTNFIALSFLWCTIFGFGIVQQE